MGCACLKSDEVMVKSQRVSEKESNSSRRHRDSHSNHNNNNSGHLNRGNSASSREQNNNIQNSNPNSSVRNSQVHHRNSNINRHSSNNQNNLPVREPNRQISEISGNNITGAMPYLPSNSDPDFNFPEVADVHVGSGLKRMKGYVCPITQEALEKKRQEFWGTRVEGNKETWEFLQIICNNKEIEQGSLKEYLNAAGVIPANRCINVTFDSRGYCYEIPNYCINEPHKFEVSNTEKNKTRPKEKKIEVIIRKLVEEKKYTLKNTSTIEELKKQISETFCSESPLGEERIRLFFGGKELVNSNELWFYNIEDESIIILMVKPVE